MQPRTETVGDRRLTPANGRVAAAHLRGTVEADRFVDGTPAAVAAPLADLRPAPDSPVRDRQLLRGADVTVWERGEGWAFVSAVADGYTGYVAASALGDPVAPTHRVGVAASHIYPVPDMKVPATARLSLGARIEVVAAADDRFFEMSDGAFVPRAHLRPIIRPFSDWASVAQLFFGVPYLWGGNTADGIDCSGLVQVALHACDLPCPGDSDLQQALGSEIAPEAPLRRGDLLFWRGHVAICVDDTVLIHANAHHMAVAYEPIADTLARIDEQGDGAVLARRRLTPPGG